MAKGLTPVTIVYKSVTASFAAGSVFVTTTLSPLATGETRQGGVWFACATVNTLRLGFNDGSQSAAAQNIFDGTPTTNFTASNIVNIQFPVKGGVTYSFSMSSAGTIILFDWYILD